MEIRARNVNEMLHEALCMLRVHSSSPEQTRNGPVLAFPEPVTLVYTRPHERVLFAPLRDANPVFHLMESIWMLAGRNDVAFPVQFNSTFGQFSDDGRTFNAAYGHRWREHFGRDQLVEIVKLLRRDPSTRQAVLQMWDPEDLTRSTKDKACNMSIVFDCRGHRLNMTVMNRSNDLIWGTCGANAVHMSILQEFVACSVGLPVGHYRQFANNLHLYLETYDGQRYLDRVVEFAEQDLYETNQVIASPLMLNGDYEGFLRDCEEFCNNPFDTSHVYRHPFFQAVAVPMAMVSRVRKSGAGTGEGWAAAVKASDWRRAVQDWIRRREAAKTIKAAAVI